MKRKLSGVVMQIPSIENSQELEYHTYKNYNCLDCGEEIFNPICPSCLAFEFKHWISKYPKLEEKFTKKIERFLRLNKNFRSNSHKCIICKRDSVYLCPYCFTEYIMKILKKEKISSKILNEFLFMFNFDLEHTGYAKNGLEMPESFYS